MSFIRNRLNQIGMAALMAGLVAALAYGLGGSPPVLAAEAS